MWLFDRDTPESNPYEHAPFCRITQISYLPQRLAWTPYPHFHENEFELDIVTKGNVFAHLPGSVMQMTEGDFISIPPNVAHCIRYNESGEVEHHAVRFSSDSQREWPQDIIFATSSAKIGMIRQLLMIIQDIAEENDALIDARVQTLALAVLEIAEKEFESSGMKIAAETTEYANEILRYLQKNTHRRITMEDLSQTFHLSASHISRIFSKTYLTSPINYLIYCRMREARAALMSGNVSTARLSKELAFHNTYHFVHTFQKFFGCHPDDYLRLHGEDPMPPNVKEPVE